MKSKPDWLPEMFPVNPWTEKSYDSLYVVFRRDFINNQPNYRGYVVFIFPEQEDGKEKIFWHLTSRDDKETGERLPDLRRSERLPWVRPMIDNTLQPEVWDWDYEEGDGTIKTYVWLKDFDFVVILKKYDNGNRRLVTSFWLEYSNTKKKMQEKYDNRL